MRTRNIIHTLFLFFCFHHLNAQQNHTDTDHTDTEGHHHHHNEIGIAMAPVYFVKEKAFSYGLHLHYLHNLGESKFGLGAGYERLFDEHGHNTLGLIAGYRPLDRLSFMLSPGVTFEDEEPGELNFALHLESAYEFQVNHIHLGPVLELAYDPEDFHISLGIHIGYGF